ncbi:luciferase-type oxidoreductase [Pseudomonas sp. BIGb0408]|uniref:Luciferase-type oxidoreductase n=1 Tax=Phytopseudomonas flavescens TaxID=29435 RepID=A0A7Y9XIZ4_9GAMM|nr:MULTISPECIES: LLM class oxidoreductase [Pseudomonas]MCW2293163.1 luciferase-type oxidoreductase [Pseudomonas sp. BIGb0408]NYH72266.1 luciferase-type oxidoreductase [Pseudomonas flavescens]
MSAKRVPPNGLAESVFARVFLPGKLTFGLLTPLEGYPLSDTPTMAEHTALATLADDLGFAALWLRDVPLRDPSFGDVAQIFDPMVYAAWLAAATRRIAIGTAGMILPLRDPIAVAKQALSVDQLSQGRFVLGVSTGDRPSEYPSFGVDFENREARFRDAYAVIRTVMNQSFPIHQSSHYGRLDGTLDLIPKAFHARLPTIAVGRCGQEITWLAEHMDGWIWHQSDLEQLPALISRWQSACGVQTFKPYGYGTFFELDAAPNAPIRWGRGLRGGRNALISLWQRQRDQGVSHIALNMRVSHRSVKDSVQELADYVLPLFA